MRGLWLLFCQAAVVFAAAALVFAAYNRLFFSPSYRQAVATAAPAVVSIAGESTSGGGATGAGVIVSANGHILTNYHLVAKLREIKINIRDKEYIARLVGVDPNIDIAVLSVAARALPAIGAAKDSALAAGDVVFAIGSPFGLDRSATMGIVSAIGRDRLGLHSLENFIQTDAAINPGSSGGALVDASGNLVGINSALFYRRRGVSPQGIGFAVPAGLAMRAYRRIVAPAPPRLAWGAEARALPPRLLSAGKPRRRAPARASAPAWLLSRVWEGSAAAKAGAKSGDMLLKINGEDPALHLRGDGLAKSARVLLALRNNATVKIRLPD